jgi:hypothetical protein
VISVKADHVHTLNWESNIKFEAGKTNVLEVKEVGWRLEKALE